MHAILFALTATACTTWGVEPVEQTVTARADVETLDGATAVELDLAVEDVLEIEGGAAELAATLDVTAWVADRDAVDPARDLKVHFRCRDGVVKIDPEYADEVAEHVTLDAAHLWMPDGLDLDVDSESNVRIRGVDSQIVAHTRGAGTTLEVRDVGPVALTAGGSVTAELAHGGSIHSGEGAVDVTVTGGEFDLLTVETGSGGVTVTLPRDLPCTLDLVAGGEGTITLEVSGGRITDPANTMRTLDLHGGGPLVYIRSAASITVRDGSPVAGS